MALLPIETLGSVYPGQYFNRRKQQLWSSSNISWVFEERAVCGWTVLLEWIVLG